MAIDNEFLDKTIEHWQPFYKERLSREDAREIIENVCSLFDLLNEIDTELKMKGVTK
ncbi:MAG: hypothetical protein ACYSSI_02545 [Planctomycetota bacterium]|jgi:hypothetical protein